MSTYQQYASVVTTVIGTLAKDSELKYTANALGVLKFSIPVKTVNSEDKDNPETVWYNVVVFGKQAENMAWLKKGAVVSVTGVEKVKYYIPKDQDPESLEDLVIKLDFELVANMLNVIDTSKCARDDAGKGKSTGKWGNRNVTVVDDGIHDPAGFDEEDIPF